MLKNKKIILENALTLKNSGDYFKAISLLKGHYKDYLDDFDFLFLYSSVLYKNKDFYKSAKVFKKLTQLKPDWELVSLGLFHSYMESNRQSAAIKEMNRFIKENGLIKHYLITLEELIVNAQKKPNEFLNKIIIKNYNIYFKTKIK